MPASAEWLLRPSARQRWLDAAFVLVVVLLLSGLLPLSGWVLSGMLLSALMLLGWRRFSVHKIGCDRRGWWLEQHGRRVRVRWRYGSVRRADVLILEWSFWPWQRLMIRPDSVGGREDFRRLTAALYNDLH
ncbi:MAG: hypothetical protein LRY66_09900 [Saccharospirillaceae bacterium]|nr:hypothetical protein [Saccharospirillaceae bacterium]MCD8531652.1 hypothetical protein [Saccharospirillaceae bacterium]